MESLLRFVWGVHVDHVVASQPLRLVVQSGLNDTVATNGVTEMAIDVLAEMVVEEEEEVENEEEKEKEEERWGVSKRTKR